MATAQPKSGINEYTATSGSGALTLTGATPGFRGFVSADDGLTYHYAIFQDQTTFETGVGTYTHGIRQLSRTTVLANINGTSTPVNLGAGTKEVACTIPGERVAMLDCVGEWAADQHYNGFRLYLDTAQTSWLDMASAGIARLYIASVLVWQSSGGLGNMTLIGSDDTATLGPSLTLRRDSVTSVANDGLFVIEGQGKDASGATQSVFRLNGRWLTTTAGSHSSTADLAISRAGALQTIMTMAPGRITLPTGVDLFGNGKIATGLNAVGYEIYNTGEAAFVTQDSTPLYAYRKGGSSAAVCVACGLNGTYQGGLILNGSTISVDGAVMTHRTEWSAGYESPDHEGVGWVVCSAQGIVEDGSERHPMIRLSTSRGDRAVYGVTANRLRTPDERSYLLVDGAGSGIIRVAGAIKNGDLMESSDIPGVACCQDDDLVRASTIAKAREDSEDDGSVRIIACTLMAG